MDQWHACLSIRKWEPWTPYKGAIPRYCPRYRSFTIHVNSVNINIKFTMETATDVLTEEWRKLSMLNRREKQYYMEEVASDFSYLTPTVQNWLFFPDGLTTIPFMKRACYTSHQQYGNDSNNPKDGWWVTFQMTSMALLVWLSQQWQYLELSIHDQNWRNLLSDRWNVFNMIVFSTSLSLKYHWNRGLLSHRVKKLDHSIFISMPTFTLYRILSRCWLSSSISAASSSSLTSPVRESPTIPLKFSSRPPIFLAFRRIFPLRS